VTVTSACGLPIGVSLMFDTASPVNLIDESLVSQLEHTEVAVGCVRIRLDSTYALWDHYEGDFRVLPKFSRKVPRTRVAIEAGLKEGKLADPYFNLPKSVDILLGIEAAMQTWSGEIKRVGSLITIPSRFGLLVGGRAEVEDEDEEEMLRKCVAIEKEAAAIKMEEEKLEGRKNRLRVEAAKLRGLFGPKLGEAKAWKWKIKEL
jgi:hypothetical protein